MVCVFSFMHALDCGLLFYNFIVHERHLNALYSSIWLNEKEMSKSIKMLNENLAFGDGIVENTYLYISQ